MKNRSLIVFCLMWGSLAAACTRAEVDVSRFLSDTPPAPVREVRGETTRLSPDAPWKWARGSSLRELRTLGSGEGVPANGAIDASSIVVRHKDRTLVAGKDYVADPVWGSLGIGPEPSITPNDEVTVDYRYSLRRIDSVVRRGNGRVELISGEPHLTMPLPPALAKGDERLANIFVDYFQTHETAELFPIMETPDEAVTGTTPERLARVMGKIQRGEPVTIVCWGDSVTVGGDSSTPELRYSAVFERRLREKFPQAKLTVHTIAVGGSNSMQWLDPDKYKHPSGACDWQKIADAKPDLITLEFVNDSGFGDGPLFKQAYGDILQRANALHAELILITPHFTMPEMMGFSHLREPEKRPYVLALRAFADEHGLALADAAARWEHLWKEGLPYITLLRNGINHPDDRGHALFADELMRCFQ